MVRGPVKNNLTAVTLGYCPSGMTVVRRIGYPVECDDGEDESDDVDDECEDDHECHYSEHKQAAFCCAYREVNRSVFLE